MCGIAGIVSKNGQAVALKALEQLEAALAHRGPDGVGRYTHGATGLVHTRLAIIDLNTGDQPFESDDGVVLIANGEIYNDPDIRKQLPDAPYRTGSDCESPLHLYRTKGLDFADDLRGMYAIAIYDKHSDTLVLSRDPFGIKQIYYVSTPDYFAFASEPQALIAANLADRGLIPQKRNELLQLKFTTGKVTIYPGIHRLLPGETLVIIQGEITERRRRRALPEKISTLRSNQDDLLTKLDGILIDSVRAHVRSDAPYGLFLSGGIDSSVMLALMSRLSSQPVIAMTAVFPDSKAKDEGESAARAARSVGAEHHNVALSREDFWNYAPRVAAALDDPTTDAAAFPTYMLARLAQEKGIKVVLSGEGADEVFGGYSRYRRATWFWGLLNRKSRSHGVFDKLDGKEAFPGWRDGFQITEREESKRRGSAMQILQAVDCAEWLPNDLLIKLDRCLMAFGVEGRTPFLDPVVSPFAFGLPDSLKMKNGLGKWLLRQWLAKNLPSAEAFAKKSGFNPPMGEWIDSYKNVLEEAILAQPGIAEMSIAPVVHATFSEPALHSQAAWSLLFYALWHSHHILGVDSEGTISDVLHEAAKRG